MIAEAQKLAQALYERETMGKLQPWDSQEFPAWDALSDAIKQIWIEKAQYLN